MREVASSAFLDVGVEMKASLITISPLWNRDGVGGPHTLNSEGDGVLYIVYPESIEIFLEIEIFFCFGKNKCCILNYLCYFI